MQFRIYSIYSTCHSKTCPSGIEITATLPQLCPFFNYCRRKSNENQTVAENGLQLYCLPKARICLYVEVQIDQTFRLCDTSFTLQSLFLSKSRHILGALERYDPDKGISKDTYTPDVATFKHFLKLISSLRCDSIMENTTLCHETRRTAVCSTSSKNIFSKCHILISVRVYVQLGIYRGIDIGKRETGHSPAACNISNHISYNKYHARKSLQYRTTRFNTSHHYKFGHRQKIKYCFIVTISFVLDASEKTRLFSTHKLEVRKQNTWPYSSSGETKGS